MEEENNPGIVLEEEDNSIQEDEINPLEIMHNRLLILEEDNKKFKAYHKATAEELRIIKDNFKLLVEKE